MRQRGKRRGRQRGRERKRQKYRKEGKENWEGEGGEGGREEGKQAAALWLEESTDLTALRNGAEGIGDQITSQEVVSSVSCPLWKPLWIKSMFTSKIFLSDQSVPYFCLFDRFFSGASSWIQQHPSSHSTTVQYTWPLPSWFKAHLELSHESVLCCLVSWSLLTSYSKQPWTKFTLSWKMLWKTHLNKKKH